MKNKEKYIQKFLNFIEKTDSCWIWKRSKHIFGYGQFCMNGKRYDAHRAAWLLFKQEDPKGLSVCHKCDNPPCCNPDHLFLASQGDNIRDCFSKKRGNPPKGARCRTAILTPENVIEMRSLRVQGFLYKEICKKFSVSQSTAIYAVTGKTWTDI